MSMLLVVPKPVENGRPSMVAEEAGLPAESQETSATVAPPASPLFGMPSAMSL